MVVSAGTLIGRRYRVLEIAGRGTSSIVYRARDAAGTDVAVKAIREELMVESEITATLQRFDREVLIGRALLHPRIAQLLASGEHDGLPYLVMEFVAGDTFDALIRAHAPLPPAQVCDIVTKVLDALDHAHRHAVIHRDVKPANIVLRTGGSDGDDPVLMDFGIAQHGASDLTRHGELLGTPTYLAPEQLRGEPIDARADLFAVGVMLYFAVTGRRPFEGSVADIMRRICFDDPVPPSHLAPGLDALDQIILRALAKRPDARYRSAAAFADELRSVVFTPAPAPAGPVAEATRVARVATGPVTLEELDGILARASSEGVNETLTDHIRTLLQQVAEGDEWRLAQLCGGPSFARLADLLLDTAPLPGRRVAPRGHWVSGLELFRLMLRHALYGPEAEAAGAVAAHAHYYLAAGVLAYNSEVAERLMPAEAPDLGRHALDLLRVDSISFGLARLGAVHERRLVEATGRVTAAQVVRRAAEVMQGFAAGRDPLARFDVAAMLVNVEDLVALAQRLVEDADQAAAGQTDPVSERSIAALTALLDAMTALVAAAGQELDEALASPDADIGRFIGDLKQMLLIHRFCIRLPGEMFHARLTRLSHLVYALVTRLGELARGQARLDALYEIASAAGWKDLAGRLLTRLRRGQGVRSVGRCGTCTHRAPPISAA